ncbi:MAG: hypothetical protein J7500_12585 [Sphingomonas sp.]|uniref:hypothetical protein n=1 Tax=Sphingomonas sp. TaxID=28214 RepID=UPI001B26D33B|nr:hypothetical protein [Sphingomonas sp.]MBO9623538.1 hypothetical protein [Sphingomonas sp.]
MAEPRPSDRRLGRAATIIAVLVVAIVVVIFITFNLSHDRALKNELITENAAAPAP